MLAGVSHDLRTPLTRMKLQLSLLKDEKAKSELEFDIGEMTAMLDSYVSFVRTEAPEPIENINLNQLLKDIIKNFDLNNFEINFIEKNIVKTSCRTLQLKRAFQNIIDNSIRYSNKLNIEIFLNDDGCVIVIEDIMEIRPMVYISLTFDHRIIDGAYADEFLKKVKTELEQWT